MIVREHDTYFLICDLCDAYDAGEYESFTEAAVSGRANGWHAVKKCGEWENRCPECWKDGYR